MTSDRVPAVRAAFPSLLVICLLFVGCGSTAPPSPSSIPTVDPSAAATPSSPASDAPTPAATPSPTPVSPARGVTSDDGLLTIDIPAGALSADVDFRALAQGEGDLPPELFGLNVRSAFYRLEPDGTVFASQVTITRRVALKDLGFDIDEDGLPILALAMRSAGGTWEWLQDQRLTLDGGFVVVSGTASHASLVFAFGGTTFTRFSTEGESPRPLGGLVTLTATLEFPDDAADPPRLADAFMPIVASDIVALGLSSSPQGNSLSQGFRCLRNGTSFVGVRYSVLNVGAESVLFRQLGLGPVSSEVTMGTVVTCQTAATPTPSAPLLPSLTPVESPSAAQSQVVSPGESKSQANGQRASFGGQVYRLLHRMKQAANSAR